MRIKSLQLTNFRCFENLELEFSERLTVILGINGSGKTAILDSISLPLENFIKNVWMHPSPQRKVQVVSHGYKGHDMNMRNATFPYAIGLEVMNDNKTLKGRYSAGKNTGGFRGDITFGSGSLIQKLESDVQTNISILMYSKSKKQENLITKNISEKTKYHQNIYKQLFAYDDFMKFRIDDFRLFANWFESLTNYENAIRLDENPNYRDKQLEVIRQVIVGFMAQMAQSQFKNLRVKKSKENDRLFSSISSKLIISKNNIDLDLLQLSSGEKSILLLVIDIAMRLAIANPSRENALEGEGIILIDEIELHLHPQWQRQIIPALMATFPNCQFIVTTHSPQVVSQVKRENIIILDNNQVVQNVPFTYGKDSNTLLNEVFQTPERPIEIQKQLDKCFKLIDMENLAEAKNALRDLAEILGENDPEILRANAML